VERRARVKPNGGADRSTACAVSPGGLAHRSALTLTFMPQILTLVVRTVNSFRAADLSFNGEVSVGEDADSSPHRALHSEIRAKKDRCPDNRGRSINHLQRK
jgi:hypothetical protein